MRHPRRPVAPHPRTQGGTVIANRRDMRVAVVPREDRPHEGRQHRTLARRTVALVSARAVCHPSIEQAAYFEKFVKHGNCPSGVIPLNVDPATKRIQRNRHFLHCQCLAFRFTDRVTPPTKKYPANLRPARLKLIRTTIQLSFIG